MPWLPSVACEVRDLTFKLQAGSYDRSDRQLNPEHAPNLVRWLRWVAGLPQLQVARLLYSWYDGVLGHTPLCEAERAEGEGIEAFAARLLWGAAAFV